MHLKPCLRRERGFSLVQFAILTVVVAVGGFFGLTEGLSYLKDKREERTAQIMVKIADATRAYLKKNYSMCAAPPVASRQFCFRDNEARIIEIGIGRSASGDGTLIGEESLPKDADLDVGFDQTVKILAYQEPRSNPSDPSKPLYVLLLTQGGNPIPNGSLFSIARRMGTGGGFISDKAPFNTANIYGSEGAWMTPVAFWSSRFPSVKFEAGHIAYSLSTTLQK